MDSGGRAWASYRVDASVPDEWPGVVASQLNVWKQGDLITDVPISWSGPAAEDAVTGVRGRGAAGVVAGESLYLSWAIITSQTCDIGSAGPGAKHPFVHVSPVEALPPEWASKEMAIRNYEVTYLAPVESLEFEGLWVADLRLNVPVSKALLLERDHRHGFTSEPAALAFSEHAAARLRRPALADVLSEDLTKLLGAAIDSGPRAAPEWWQKVEQVRLFVTGDRLAPAAVQLLVLQQQPLSTDEKKLWRDLLKPVRRLLRPHGIAVSPFVFESMGSLAAAQFVRSVPLFIPGLQRPRTAL